MSAPATNRLKVAADDPCLTGHFPDRPVVPAAALLDRLAAWVEAVHGVEVVGVARARFNAALLPDTPWDVRAEPDDAGAVKVTCSHDGARTMTATFLVTGQVRGQVAGQATGAAGDAGP